MRAILFAATAMFLSCNVAFAEPGIISGRDLFDDAEKIRGFMPKDQFDSPPNFDSLIGRKFAIDIPIEAATGRNSQVCIGSPSYLFSPDKGMTIRYGDTEINLKEGMKPQFSIGCRVTHRTERQSNAFGATAAVEVETQYYTAIEGANLEPTFGGNRFTSKVTADVARNTASFIAIRVEGTIVASESGHPIDCRDRVSRGSLDSPFETIWNGCHISADISSLALVIKTTTGELVKALQLHTAMPN